MKPQVITKITQRDVTEAEKWWAMERQNQARLNACPGPHDFQAAEHGKIVTSMVTLYRCRKCQGEICPTGKGWYEQGLKHGKLAG